MKQVLCMVIALGAVQLASAAGGDERFLAGREAARAGDLARLHQLAGQRDGDPLDAYIDYWALSVRLARKDDVDADLAAFTAREEGTLLAERARNDWIRAAARAQRWDLVLRESAMLRQPDQEMNCWTLQARFNQGDPHALKDAEAQWDSTAEPGEACTPVIAAVAVSKSEDAIWQRARRLVDARRYGAAAATVATLPPPGAPATAVSEALDKPLRWLSKNLGINNRTQREITVLALARLAQTDYSGAAARVEALGTSLSPGDRAWLSGVLGWQAARGNQPEALAWYRAAGSAPLSEESRAWQVRAALRNNAWGEVRRAIEAMPPSQRKQPEWIYWYGRALLETKRVAQGREELERIADTPSFYGMLAGEELGRPFVAPRGAKPPSRSEIAKVESDVSIRRSLALFRLDGRVDGVREWNWAMRGADDRTLLAAAELARREQLYDRAIYSADRTQTEHDYGLRYLVPHFDKVEPATKRWGLDVFWVYGLIRQESRFVTAARSSAGAQGLMQVMPGTATYVAKKLGVPYSRGQAYDMDTNIMLGTAYLKMVLDKLDGNPALASAAYNAGPGRIPRWKASSPMEGAVFAETIPLSETRDYVKKVLANSVAYAAVLTGKPQSLKQRLGIIQPAGTLGYDAAELNTMPSGDGANPP
ncbi:lytic transglycosylase domain-containing protein [Niveibacterium sp. 24ML]|uniref:lytic transglycosylase domain-containing protein n=1 Tax=Niveibacterium sp. 24ML TaxID=2985512 RepID=UPI00226EA099|nr:lytic transglycosylase domain-containing protein [Niveibacterium sp. 24ML]MCX9157513.1 lytic transglycosylase domain-containing protein [Niveibacterium sp. 24ML]